MNSKTALYFEKICIIGVGLIGGSLASRIKQEKLAGKITGFGRSKENLELARALGVIDDYTFRLDEAVEGSSLIVLATPIKAMPRLAAEMLPYLGGQCLLTDVGSVKGWVVEQMERILPENIHFVPAHPIAGSEQSGVKASSPDLFQRSRCILTPTERTDRTSLGIIEEMWKRAGSLTLTMSPEEHDDLLAAVSHLPHILAYTLVGTVGEAALGVSGGGFKDTTRIALSDPELWRDICLANKKRLLQHLDRFMDNLKRVRVFIDEDKREELNQEFLQARLIRSRLR